MLSFTGSLKVFVALEPIDMRKGFEGLYAAVAEKLKADVRSGTLFAFTNKKRTRLKVTVTVTASGGGLTMIVDSSRP